MSMKRPGGAWKWQTASAAIAVLLIVFCGIAYQAYNNTPTTSGESTWRKLKIGSWQGAGQPGANGTNGEGRAAPAPLTEEQAAEIAEAGRLLEQALQRSVGSSKPSVSDSGGTGPVAANASAGSEAADAPSGEASSSRPESTPGVTTQKDVPGDAGAGYAAPPAPADPRQFTRGYPPGITLAALEEARVRLEALASRTRAVDDPSQPWNRHPETYELHRVDKYNRFNPSFRAVTSDNDTVFVKFPCIAGHPDLDSANRCGGKNASEIAEAPLAHTLSIQRVSDECGFETLKTRYWGAPVTGKTPQGVELHGQLGLFAEWAEGESPESWPMEKKGPWLDGLPIEWVWWGALHDFILCESDRHQGNLLVQRGANGTFIFIDNDHELSNSAAMNEGILKPANAHCTPSSLFFPMNLEAWRVWKLRLPLARLDYRCWVGPDLNIPIPSRISACLHKFAAAEPAALQREYGMVQLAFAEGLHQRAKDLLELGFWQALLRTCRAHGEREFWEHPNRPGWDDRQLPHWHEALWRPLQDPLCDFSDPKNPK